MVFGIVSSLLIGLSALSWLLTRHRCGADTSILEWACRIVPIYCVFAPFVIWASHSLLVALLVGTVLLGGIAACCGWRPFPGKGVPLNVIAGMVGAFLSCLALCSLCAFICLPLSMRLKFPSELSEPLFVKGPWRGDKPTKEVPFKVEFRTAHAFLAEYDRRVVFKSGKHVNLWPDTGGLGEFALYRLADGSYYLVDGLQFSANRCEYRVDTSSESVDLVKRVFFYAIPERGILAGIGWSDQDNDMTFSMVDEKANDLNGERKDVLVKGRSVGDALTKRRFLGFVDTHGSFSPSTDDPLP